MDAMFERFTLKMSMAQAQSAAHQGACDDDVAVLCEFPSIQRQIKRIGPDAIRAELKEYGAWDETELSDDGANVLRIVWIAAGNITEQFCN